MSVPRWLAPLLLFPLSACGGAPPAAASAPGDAAAEGPAPAEGDGAPADAGPGEPGPAAGGPADAGPAGPPAGAPAGPPAGPPAGKAPPPGEPAEPPPKPSAMDLAGTLSPAQIAKFVEDHQDRFDPCIQIAEKAGPTYKVSITTKVWVGPRGRVNKTEVLKTTSKDAAFGACVTKAFESIAFGKPKDGATATLTFPMTFSGEVQ